MPALAAAAPWLASASPYIALGATALSAHQQIQAGKQAAHRADVIARQQEEQAKAEQAAAQQEANGERKKARYLRSRALAVAGASGAGVSDPTINNILAGIDTQGEMNALSTLWSGDTTANGLRREASATRAEGRASRRASNMGAFTTVLDGGMDFMEAKPTFFSKYGGKRAKSMGMGTAYDDFSRGIGGMVPA